MPTKPIDRLLFAQGGLCFFCQRVLTPEEASVEHLVATSNGGSNDPDNCVACCKDLNALLGRMSLKEKFRVVLNQRGEFKCPNGGAAVPKATHQSGGGGSSAAETAIDGTVVPEATHQIEAQRLALVVSDLRRRAVARPGSVKALGSTIGALFRKQLSEHEIASLITQLQAQGIISVNGTKVSYVLPPGVA